MAAEDTGKDDRSVGRSVALDLGNDAPLLSALLSDARASYQDLAAKVGTSRQSAWRRVGRLMGRVIWGFTAIVDYHQLGWRRYLIIIPGAPEYETILRVEEAEAAIASAGNVRVLESTLVRGSSWRFIIQIAAKNSLSMELFREALRERLPDRNTEILVEEVEYVVRDGGFRNPARHELQHLTRGGKER